ncbi:hypothetical protein EZI45_19155 [Delftia tsuruhatensis]|uniref:hypothetical protein n=1 Tax=Delftia tsuruhatensis TaxID=180282 RepID=UPI001056BAA5|nr:hypothetical protein [Delftia tsuruhatensis]TDF26240.1 hypothetical protein EZI45_19155 [Delftia tsuruhatensis]
MYFDKETNEEPLSVKEIQERHPLTMMPQHLERYEFIEPAATPSYNPETQKPISAKSAIVDGVRRQQWSVVPLSAEELQAVAAAKAKAEQEARDAARVRVTKRQALLALYDLKSIREEAILAAINSIEDEHARYRTLVDWQGAATIENDSPTVLLLAAALNITADLPTLFDYAEAL